MCDGNCFNCPFPDCIASDEEVLAMEDKEPSYKVEVKNTKSNYYWRNREKILARYHANAEERKVYRHNYYEQNKEKAIESAKKWQKENKEKYRQYKREKYHRDKEIKHENQENDFTAIQSCAEC